MIKHVIHIDSNYPRKFNAAVSNTTISSSNWGLDTVSGTDGTITTESKAKLTTIETDATPEQTFEDNALTQTQSDNLDGQIRLDANIFNYIVHATISNVVLKYDAPVYDGLENWNDYVTVIDDRSYEYAIFFDVLVHDPIGVDAYAYDAYVRNKLFASVKRDKAVYDTTPDYKNIAVYWTDENTAVECEKGSYKGNKNYIYAGNLSNISSDDMIPSCKVLPDKYDADNNSYKIHIAFSGKGYDTNYINTSSSKYEAWLKISEDETSTEKDIENAWLACEGIKYKFYDVAGNTTYWVMPYLNVNKLKLADLNDLVKLELDFINTKPENLQLNTDLIGRTTVRVKNKNFALAGYPVVIELLDDSVGKLYKNTYKITKVSTGEKFYSIITEDVDNIDESGYVIARAYIDIGNLIGNLQTIKSMIINRTSVTGSLGEWIKECADNTRKLSLEPFVPQYLKDNTAKDSAYYNFVKFTENYLNTMYKAYDKNCYISVLEVIDRINNFNDATKIYKNLLDNYDDDHGDMLHITNSELTSIINVDRKKAN